jgi:hypothetical protein
MAPTLRNSRDFRTSKDQLEEEITPFRTTAEDRNAIRAAAPSSVGEMRGIEKEGRDASFPAQVARVP